MCFNAQAHLQCGGNLAKAGSAGCSSMLRLLCLLSSTLPTRQTPLPIGSDPVQRCVQSRQPPGDRPQERPGAVQLPSLLHSGVSVLVVVGCARKGVQYACGWGGEDVWLCMKQTVPSSSVAGWLAGFTPVCRACAEPASWTRRSKAAASTLVQVGGCLPAAPRFCDGRAPRCLPPCAVARVHASARGRCVGWKECMGWERNGYWKAGTAGL